MEENKPTIIISTGEDSRQVSIEWKGFDGQFDVPTQFGLPTKLGGEDMLWHLAIDGTRHLMESLKEEHAKSCSDRCTKVKAANDIIHAIENLKGMSEV